MRLKTISIVFVLLISMVPFAVSKSVPDIYPTTGEKIIPFNFTLTNGTIVSINDYSSKPILLEWSASWCTYCSLNHEKIHNLYFDYIDNVNFISISYNKSGDTLSDVVDMKGNYKWTFGLDHLDYGSNVSVSNAHTWIIDQNLTLIKFWKHTVISSTDVRNYLDSMLGVENSTTEPDASILELDFLITNPLFIGFSVLVLIGLGYIIIARIKN